VVKNLPFFMDRGLKETSILDALSLMTYKEVKKDDFVIEFGTFSDEFYLILEGECEVLVPDKESDDFTRVNFEMKVLEDQLKKNF
jgi:CRP-like cAMP-binding protein